MTLSISQKSQIAHIQLKVSKEERINAFNAFVSFLRLTEVFSRLIKAKDVPEEHLKGLGYTYTNKEGLERPRALEYILQFNDKVTSAKHVNPKLDWMKVSLDTIFNQNNGLEASYGVYLIPNKGGKVDSDIISSRVVFWEIDDISISEQWEKIKAFETAIGKKVSWINETLKSLHFYLDLGEDVPISDVIEIQLRGIQYFQSDSTICNPSRLMRVPGFDHVSWNGETESISRKYVKAVQVENTIFSVDELRNFFPSVHPEKVKQTSSVLNANYEPKADVYIDPSLNPFDARNLIKYVPNCNETDRPEWITASAICHNSLEEISRTVNPHSKDGLQVNKKTGGVKCWAGCCTSAEVRAALKEHALNNGYKAPSTLDIVAKQEELKPAIESNLKVVRTNDLTTIDYLPKKGYINVIKSAKGTGKTNLLSKIINSPEFENEQFLIPGHRVQLQTQIATRVKGDYIEDLLKDNIEPHTVKTLTVCVDRLHSESKMKYDPYNFAHHNVAIDEIEQVSWHSVNSATLTDNRSKVLADHAYQLKLAIQNDKAIIIADADITDDTVSYIAELAGTTKINYLINTWKPEENQKIYVYKDASPARCNNTFMKKVEKGEKILLYTDNVEVKGRYSTKNIETACKKLGKKVLRIDSHTTSDPSHPAFGASKDIDRVVQNYDVVLASPSIGTGVSIECDHFDCVFGINNGVLSATDFSQGLGRVRKPIDRHIYIQKFGKSYVKGTARATDPEACLRNMLTRNATLFAALSIVGSDYNTQRNAVHLKYFAKRAAKHNMVMWDLRAVTIDLLKKEGHEVIELEDVKTLKATLENEPENQELAEKVETIQTQIALGVHSIGEAKAENTVIECEAILESGDLTKEEVKLLSNERALTAAERFQLEKFFIKKFYCQELTYEMVENYRFKDYREKLNLHYHVRLYQKLGREKYCEIMAASFRKRHEGKKLFATDVNGKANKMVLLLENLEIEKFMDSEKVFTNESPEAIELLNKLLKNKKLFGSVFPELTDVNKNTKPTMAVIKVFKLLALPFDRVKVWDNDSKKQLRGIQYAYVADEREVMFQARMDTYAEKPLEEVTQAIDEQLNFDITLEAVKESPKPVLEAYPEDEAERVEIIKTCIETINTSAEDNDISVVKDLVDMVLQRCTSPKEKRAFVKRLNQKACDYVMFKHESLVTSAFLTPFEKHELPHTDDRIKFLRSAIPNLAKLLEEGETTKAKFLLYDSLRHANDPETTRNWISTVKNQNQKVFEFVSNVASGKAA